jgi:hypothetical protein
MENNLTLSGATNLFRDESGEEPKALRPPRSKNADAFFSTSWVS